MAKNKNKTLKFFIGIPHAHTAFSTGRGTPLEAYEYAKRKGLNFLCITDHNSFLSKELTISDKNLSKWNASLFMKDRCKKKSSSFIPLIGFESRSTYYGDFNIINPDTYFTGVIKDFNILILWMMNNPNSIITINHPHKNILTLRYSELLNKIITSIEVGNGSFPHKYMRHDKFYYALLDKGWKLGAVNGQDNHRINFGDSDNVTAIVSTELTSSNIIEAFRKRRTYSSESKTLKTYFYINDDFMGSEINITSSKLQFTIYAEDERLKITGIDIVTNSGNLVKKIDDINLNSIKYMYNHEKNSNESWYLIRIHQEGNRVSVTSPIFINKN